MRASGDARVAPPQCMTRRQGAANAPVSSFESRRRTPTGADPPALEGNDHGRPPSSITRVPDAVSALAETAGGRRGRRPGANAVIPRVEIARADDGRHVAIVREPEISGALDATALRELALALLDAAEAMEELDRPANAPG